MHRRSFLPALAALCAALLLAACGSAPKRSAESAAERLHSERGREVVMFALSLLDTGYRFGGKNPEAGVDCSGMVSYVFQNAVGRSLTGSAADIAKRGRALTRTDLAPADLVFFNTRGGPYTHVGIYIGDERFIHAPSSNGRVRIDQMDRGYFGRRYTSARTYFG